MSAFVNGAVRQGCRSAEAGGRFWAVFPASWSNDDVREEWAAFQDPDGWGYHVPGKSFAYPLEIRRSATRVVAQQFSGLDV